MSLSLDMTGPHGDMLWLYCMYWYGAFTPAKAEAKAKKRSKKKWQTSKKNFAFACASIRCEWTLMVSNNQTIDLFTPSRSTQCWLFGQFNPRDLWQIKHSASNCRNKNPLQTVPCLQNFMIYFLYVKVYYGLACKILMYLLKNKWCRFSIILLNTQHRSLKIHS